MALLTRVASSPDGTLLLRLIPLVDLAVPSAEEFAAGAGAVYALCLNDWEIHERHTAGIEQLLRESGAELPPGVLNLIAVYAGARERDCPGLLHLKSRWLAEPFPTLSGFRVFFTLQPRAQPKLPVAVVQAESKAGPQSRAQPPKGSARRTPTAPAKRRRCTIL